MPPRRSYRNKLFTTNAVGYENIQHLDLKKPEDMNKLIECALKEPGFDADSIAPHADKEPFLCGFGHAAILSHAETVINAVKAGALNHIFIIGKPCLSLSLALFHNPHVVLFFCDRWMRRYREESKLFHRFGRRHPGRFDYSHFRVR